jgi:23S rRNA (pseudouridine1915-N3)-methyltransferase
MHLIAIGRLRAGPELELFDRYDSRLRPRLRVVEVPEERGNASLPKDAFAVALDLGGHALDSEGLALRLDQWRGLSHPICFLIGGAEGLDAPVIAKANYVLSLGLMTWPHFLVRAMLAEQLYRAQTIGQGHPYHRAGRPEV